MTSIIASPPSLAAGLLARLTAELSAAADALAARGPYDDPRDAKALAELIRAHRRAALAAVESSKRLSSLKAAPSDDAAAVPLDIAAARREVMGRLARLAAAARAGQVSEQPSAGESGGAAASV